MVALVSDTSPLNYLILIEAIELLPRLFSEVIIPPAVSRELSRIETPEIVRNWLTNAPSWLKQQIPVGPSLVHGLDAGETEAISLAYELGIHDLLLDDNAARQTALGYGFTVYGTLGILVTASHRQWINFDDHLERLRGTNFRARESLFIEARERSQKA